YRTTAERLFARARLDPKTGPAEPVAFAPPQPDPNSDLSLRIHESLINHASTTFYGGRTLTDEQFDRELKDLFGPAAARFTLTKEDAEPFSIRFADRNPLEARFADGVMTTTLRGKAFTSGEREIGGWNTTAHYRLRRVDTGVRFERVG